MDNKSLVSDIPEINLYLDITDNIGASDYDVKGWESEFNSRRAEKLYEYLRSCLSTREVEVLKNAYRPGIRPAFLDKSIISGLLTQLDPVKVELTLCYDEADAVPIIVSSLREVLHYINDSTVSLENAEFAATAAKIYLSFDPEANRILERIIELYHSLVTTTKTAIGYFEKLLES